MWKAIVLLLSSRKFVMALLGLVAVGAARLGFNWSAETMFVVLAPFLAVIFGISYEDAASKRAGAGTVTTMQREPTADGGIAEIRIVEPDPSGKP